MSSPADANYGSRKLEYFASLRARHGRPAAIAWVMLFLVFVTGRESAPELALRHTLFDAYQQIAPRTRLNDAAVIVAIDEESLAELGQWPWPRGRMATLIDDIARAAPAAIGIDALFAEPDRYAPALIAAQLALTGEAIERLIATLPDPDRRLADAIGRAPVVLGIAGVDELPTATAVNGRYAPVRSVGGDPADVVRRYPAILRSIDVIDAAAVGRGVINAEIEDGMLRRVPTLVADPDGTLIPGFALETLRIALGAAPLTAHLTGVALASVEVGGHAVPTTPLGEWWLHYSPWAERPQYSAAAVMRGAVPAEHFAGRIVLVGYTALGLQDNVSTPLGRMPGVHVHAEAIDNLNDGRLLNRPTWAEGAELTLLIVLAGTAIVLVPQFKPRHAAFGMLGAGALVLGFGIAAFVYGAWLLDVATPALAAAVVFAIMLTAELSQTQRQRAALRRALVDSHAAQLRLEGELDAARRIQMAMLPLAPGRFVDEPRIDIAALMRPARSVGGDLYDFFAIDPHRVFFLIGDVSGKGLPAAMFMALAKALIRGVALRLDGDPGGVLSEAGRALAEHNSEMLFVTVFAGLLDLETGMLVWSNAGHESPWQMSPRTAPRRGFDAGGPPLCVLDDFDYPSARTRLAPADTLCLVTDGVSEAQDAVQGLFGAERLAAVLAAAAPASGSRAVVEAVERAVDAHADGTEQADDVAVLVIAWRGRT